MTEVRVLQSCYSRYTHFYVLNDKAMLPEDMIGKTIFIAHSERDWRFLLNLWEAFRILHRERPKVILSTGAGPAVPFALVGRFLFGCRVVFIETVTRINAPSMTGKIMYLLAHDFFYQWESLARFFPRGRWGGPLL